MERGLRDLEEEIQMLKSNGALSTEEREEEMKQMEVYRSHSKFMKNKVLRTLAAALRSAELRNVLALVRRNGLGSQSNVEKQNWFNTCHETIEIT